MGLDTRSNASLWKDFAMVELNYAVMYSYQVNKISLWFADLGDFHFTTYLCIITLGVIYYQTFKTKIRFTKLYYLQHFLVVNCDRLWSTKAFELQMLLYVKSVCQFFFGFSLAGPYDF